MFLRKPYRLQVGLYNLLYMLLIIQEPPRNPYLGLVVLKSYVCSLMLSRFLWVFGLSHEAYAYDEIKAITEINAVEFKLK